MKPTATTVIPAELAERLVVIDRAVEVVVAHLEDFSPKERRALMAPLQDYATVLHQAACKLELAVLNKK